MNYRSPRREVLRKQEVVEEADEEGKKELDQS
jgi:hypothetical protein